MLAGQSRLVSDIDARGFAAACSRHPAVRPALRRRRPALRPLCLPGLPRRQDAAHLLATGSAISRCATPSTSPKPPPPSTNSPAAASSWASPPATVPSSSPPTACNTTSAPSASPRRSPTSAACSNPAVAPDLAARPHHRRRTPAQARRRPHPLLVTGASGQSPDWIAAHADGWLTYPGSSVVPAGPKVPGPENPGLARPHPRRRLPPSRHQRMDRPGRRPRAPAHPAARRFHPADRPPRAHRSALAMADCRRQPRRPASSSRAAPPPKPSRNWRRKCCRASRRMRMCRHWIWIGRRDCESSVRTAIRMNGEQQATQHTPTLTARQGTPLHNQHPHDASHHVCRNRPPARPVSAGDANPAPDHGSSNATSIETAAPRARRGCEQPRCARGNPKAAAAGGNEDDEGARLGKSGARLRTAIVGASSRDARPRATHEAHKTAPQRRRLSKTQTLNASA